MDKLTSHASIIYEFSSMTGAKTTSQVGNEAQLIWGQQHVPSLSFIFNNQKT